MHCVRTGAKPCSHCFSELQWRDDEFGEYDIVGILGIVLFFLIGFVSGVLVVIL